MSIKKRSDYELESSPINATSLDEYKYQVGGQGMKISKKYSILDDGAGRLYKPVLSFPRGEKEIIFYQNVFNPNGTNSVLKDLQKFIPKFFGLYSYNNPLKDNLYIGIEDLLYPFHMPSVVDMKVGQRSYVPGASTEKIEKELKRYLWRETVGFIITGIRVKDTKPILLDRYHWRKLDPEEVYHKGIKVFLGSDPMKAKILAGKFISKLHSLLGWFKNQTELAFVGSSLIMAFDNVNYKCIGNGEIDSKNLYVHNVLLKFIDFTHVVPINDHDQNFIYGIESLMKYLKRVQIDNNY